MNRFRFPHLLATIALFISLACGYESALGQTPPRKLPSAEKVIDNYFKAIGGKKAVAGIRDTTYDYSIHVSDQPFGLARAQTKIPGSERWEMTFCNGKIIFATNSGSAWERGINGELRTLTGNEAAAAKLRGILNASRLVNIKKSNVLARVVSVGDLASEPAYIVEFSTRNGARLQYYFSIKTGLITKIADDVRKNRIFFEDYKRTRGVLEPHKIRLNLGSGEMTLQLQTVT